MFKITDEMNKLRLQRKECLKALMRFIATADADECAAIISQIRVVHDNVLFFDIESEEKKRICQVTNRGGEILLSVV